MAGEGTRLLPLTKNIPKPMVEVGGKPIIERIINKLILEGFKILLFLWGIYQKLLKSILLKVILMHQLFFQEKMCP